MRRIGVLMGTAFIDMIGFAIVAPLLPFYALRFNAPYWMIGWLIAMFAVMQLISAPLWGKFSDGYGRRPAILLGLCISAVAFALFAFANSITMLLVTRLVQGIGGGTTPVLMAYVADSTAPKDRVKALGWLSAATSAGVMVGPAIGSFSVGFGAALPGLIASGLCLINILFAWRLLPESHGTKARADEAASRSTRQPIRHALRDVVIAPRREVSRLIWIYAVGMLGFMSMTSVMALYLESQFGITARTIGPFFVYIGLLSIVMRAVVLGRAVDRFGEIRVMRTGAISLALGLFLIPLPTFVLGTAVVMSLVPIGTALLFPNVSALISHRALKTEVGQTLGVQQSFGGMARVVAPLWATAVLEIDLSLPFFVAAGVVALVTLLAFSVKQAVAVPEAA